MSKKDKYAEEYKKLKREVVIDKVNKVFKKDPVNYRKGLEDLGFTWFDDEYDPEKEEEITAVPQNDRQESLVAYFEGRVELSESLPETLQAERLSDSPNYPLIRKYFRCGNDRLKDLIILRVEKDPTNPYFLSDLAFFHEFSNMLPELIDRYAQACQLEEDLQKFSELAQNFYYGTLEDNYDALQALRNLFNEESDKRKIIDFLISEHKIQGNQEVISF
ncbi:MAG: hypothetical protein U9O82_06200 [Thermodesulfobacteriota bacterium]|nr:hypothetical protein [Thermodesulfobacteriota bacterium]